jgi:transposase
VPQEPAEQHRHSRVDPSRRELSVETRQRSAEFRADAVTLVRSSDRPVAQLAQDLGVHHETLNQWVEAAEQAEALTESAKDAEIAQLRSQVQELRSEREILLRATKQRPRRTGW